MRVLVALGGNPLIHRGETAEAATRRGDMGAIAEALVSVAEEHELVIAHAFDVRLGGALGLALRNALPDRDLATVLIDTVVEADASGLLGAPLVLEPRAIVELRSLRTLIDAGVLVICAGGVGIPVALDSDGAMHGVEAVVDKELTAALLARRLDADVLVMLTDVDAMHLDWGGECERPLGSVTPEELRRHDFAAESMGPKVDAACRFVEATGHRAAIGELAKAVEIARGESGTQICAQSASAG